MRFALDPENRVVPDLRGRLPGRGTWLTPTAEAVREAVRRRLFSRAFKAETTVAPDLAEQVDAALLRDLLGSLSMANKAGRVTAGFGKVDAALRAGEAAALIHAREAAPDGRRKLAGARLAAGPLRKGPDGSIYEVDVLDDLSESELDVALGRVGVIHAALLAGPGSEGCLSRWRRLRAYRGSGNASAVAGAVHDRQPAEDQGGRTKTV